VGARAVSDADVLPALLCSGAVGAAALLRCKICTGCRSVELLTLLVRSQRLLMLHA
jgi:hypothetical protein